MWQMLTIAQMITIAKKKASPKILAKIDFIYLDDQALIRSFKIYMYKDQ